MPYQEELLEHWGLLEIFGLGSFPMQKPSWDEENGWTEELFEENALTSDKEVQ